MSYQVLARKWRPSNFTEVAGQAHVLKSLINALDNQRLHHAYLFTGTRGVGKTTLARILAKCLNCEEGVSSIPCEKCDSCREISEGRFIDLHEVDAASRTKVEDTRELLENVQYTPARGRYKVYLIDEVHMLSTHSFNALLKTLEEPPPHVKFLFATTDPQKLPITILSRCLQFNLKNLSPKMISDYLGTVLKQEEITFDEEALWQIAAAAAGSMRDALTLVDQAISFCDGSVTASGVVEMLGIPEQEQVFQLLSNMARGDVKDVLQLVSVIAEQTPDYAHTLDSLLSLLHRVAIAQVMPDAIDNSFGDKGKVLKIAGEIAAEDVQLYYQIGSKGREELRYSAEVRATFEMLLLRMMVFSPTYVAGETKESNTHLESVSKTANQSATIDIEKKKLTPANTALVEVSPNNTARVNSPSAEAISCLTPENGNNTRRLPSAKNTPNNTVNSSHIAAIEPEVTLADHESIDEYSTLGSDRGIQPQPQKALAPDPNSTHLMENTSENAAESTANNLAVKPANVKHADSKRADNISLQNLDHDLWLTNFASVPANGIVANVLANTQILSVAGNIIQLRLDVNQSAVFGDELLERIAAVFSDWLNEKITVAVVIAEVDKETPALLSQRLRAEKHAKMVMDFEQDSTVQDLLARFSGSIVQDSISSIQAKDNSKGGR
ncbi:MAG: DNA polymerase-3 subunit gamma/tau [Pseudohongiellaceae bacterium]|jgi:DNA polymerase-3 subunit gamma/tau